MEDQSTTTQRDFIGVRKRKWGKWVSEIREPGKKTRIWLGSYEEPEMAAAAYDVAAWHLKGQRARLNFPELADSLPKPASSSAEDVQSAAQEAAMQFKGTRQRRQQEAANVVVPATVGLSWSQIEAINASPLDSPKMWMELAGALLSGEPHHINEFEEWEELQNNSIWD